MKLYQVVKHQCNFYERDDKIMNMHRQRAVRNIEATNEDACFAEWRVKAAQKYRETKKQRTPMGNLKSFSLDKKKSRDI